MTALRWARLLRHLGHSVHVLSPDAPLRPADLLIALHARRSARSVRRFRQANPSRPVIVALTGTDVYHDLSHSLAARHSLASADRLVTLQPLAARQLPGKYRRKVRVIHQSVQARSRRWTPATRFFAVCVLGHLRPVKDPLRAAFAARGLPAWSRLRVRHAGRALTAGFAAAARAEMRRNPRYRWLGELSHGRSMDLLARSHLLVLSSRMEGGANVIGEAATCGVSVLASRIDGNVGLLGTHYPGYFPVGDTGALAALMRRAESDERFYRSLRSGMHRIAPLFDPAREKRAWRDLLRELSVEKLK